MRRILSKEELAEREKKRNRIITIVMLIILVGSTAGYAFMYTDFGAKDDNAQTASGAKIQNYGNQYVVSFSGNQHIFSSSPESSFNSTELNFVPDISRYYNKPLYIDSKSDSITSEIATNLGAYAERVNKACYGSCNESDLPEKDCADNMVIYTQGEENKITQKDNCIFIEGDIRAVDAFLYREIGVA